MAHAASRHPRDVEQWAGVRGGPSPAPCIVWGVHATSSPNAEPRAYVKGVHGVRYQVKDVARAVSFYTQHLGFTLQHQHLPEFASVSLGDTQILLSGPGASGSRPMPDGQHQEPGGWNRVVLRVADLPAFIDTLKNGGVRLRNEIC